MFSKTCEYAIKAMIYVAQNSSAEKRISIKEIARETAAPEYFVAKIMQDLRKRKLIHSIKGPNGGFYLNDHDLKSTIADIVIAIDGNGIYTECVLGLKACTEKTPCPVHFEFVEVKKNLIKMLEKNTIRDCYEKIESGKFFLKKE